jgi:hypothetical protein
MITLTLTAIPKDSADPNQYVVDLLYGDYAILTRLSPNAWDAKVYQGDAQPIERGLFSSPDTALAVFQTEVSQRVIRDAPEITRRRGRSSHR